MAAAAYFATTLDGLEAKLAAKAEAAGATGYSITSANTNNKQGKGIKGLFRVNSVAYRV
jgi:hypothetical protein